MLLRMIGRESDVMFLRMTGRGKRRDDVMLLCED